MAPIQAAPRCQPHAIEQPSAADPDAAGAQSAAPAAAGSPAGSAAAGTQAAEAEADAEPGGAAEPGAAPLAGAFTVPPKNGRRAYVYWCMYAGYNVAHHGCGWWRRVPSVLNFELGLFGTRVLLSTHHFKRKYKRCVRDW